MLWASEFGWICIAGWMFVTECNHIFSNLMAIPDICVGVCMAADKMSYLNIIKEDDEAYCRSPHGISDSSNVQLWSKVFRLKDMLFNDSLHVSLKFFALFFCHLILDTYPGQYTWCNLFLWHINSLCCWFYEGPSTLWLGLISNWYFHLKLIFLCA